MIDLDSLFHARSALGLRIDSISSDELNWLNWPVGTSHKPGPHACVRMLRIRAVIRIAKSMLSESATARADAR